MFRLIAPITLLLSCIRAQDFLPTEECPLLGPIYSSDFDLTTTDAFAEAAESFPEVVEALFESGIVNASTSTFTIDVYSTVTNASIYSYSHQATAPALNETFPTGGLDEETIYRIGSVSKLLTVYAILIHTGGVEIFDHNVTQYLPELAGNSREDSLTSIIWEDVTIGALASQQAGTGGFPLALIACLPGDTEGCDTETFLSYFKDVRAPSQPVGQSALYSDGGFAVLGRVLERLTNQTYNEAIQSILGTTFGLNHTTSLLPEGDDLNAVAISSELSSWGFDNQLSAPSGGIYSNAADLRAIGISILNSEVLSPVNTRLWLKPHAHTASIVNSVGAPWEISRLTIPVSANSTRTRVSDLYTKAGGQLSYTAVFALSPDHRLGYNVLVAGPGASSDRWHIRAAVGETFIPAAEAAGHEHARRFFAGTFADEANNGTNLTFTVDDDHPGLGLPELWIDGLDGKPNFTQPGLTALPEGVEQWIRLYPTGLEDALDDGAKRLQYRAVVEYLPFGPRSRIEGGTSLFDDGCFSWANTAFLESELFRYYDEFVLEVAGDGELVGVEYPAQGKSLRRVRDD